MHVMILIFIFFPKIYSIYITWWGLVFNLNLLHMISFARVKILGLICTMLLTLAYCQKTCTSKILPIL